MARCDYWPRYGFENYTFLLPFEDSFDGPNSTGWMQKNWMHSLTASAVYLIVVFAGRKMMVGRKLFSLNTPLFLWNAGLAIFAILGFLRMTPEWIWSWTGENDLKYSICVASFAQSVSGFWAEQFALSKVFELVDTMFIVARKRLLMFLHWYHHINVLVYTWHAYKDQTAS
ncbi:hypothetical protein PENTCL1PPCAC_3924, partial [Pristionchus entomophagus]